MARSKHIAGYAMTAPSDAPEPAVDGEMPVITGEEASSLPTKKAKPEKNAKAAKQGRERDSFDEVKKSRRVGVHRIIGKPRRFWAFFVSALLGIAVLTGAGIFVITYTGTDITQWGVEEEEPPPPPPPVQPQLDPEAEVVVLNGTGMPGFGAIVDVLITKNGWGKLLFSGDAADNNVKNSAVFYSSVTDEATALGLAEELGGIPVYQTYNYAVYGSRLVVVIGQDYQGPGSDQLVLPEPEPAAEPSAEAPAE